MKQTERRARAKRSIDGSVWKSLLPFLRPYKKILAAVVGLNLLVAAIDISYPLFQRYAIDHFIQTGTLQGLGVFALCYLAVCTLQALSVVFFTRGSMVAEMQLGKDLKRACFVQLQKLSFSYYNQKPVGYLLARVMSDTNRIAGLVAWSLVDILWALTYVLGTFCAMLALNARLALLIALIVPAISLLTVYFQKRILRQNRKMRQLNSTIMGAYNEGITGAKTSKTLVIERQNEQQFSHLTGQMQRASVKAARLGAVYIPTVVFLGSLATAIVLASGGNMVAEGALLLGTLSAFISYAVSIFEPIQQIARILSDVISVQANIERVNSLLSQQPAITDSPAVTARYGDVFSPLKQNWEPLVGDIEFRDVSFKYPDGGDYVLRHFDLHIPAGTTVAIVGETGAGKSTLVNLACRFFEPTEGQILIDGRDYRERSQLWLHQNIGYVLQSPHLFSGTVMENIRYGRLDATDREVIAAAKSVHADAVAARLKDGYQSDVGEGGDLLSTGEKQLISFARAVLSDPRIFVLDEATSSIDTRTEQLIQNATEKLLQGRTSFLIAHRLSTIRKADVILVVKDGRVVQRGTHQQLLQKGGYYRDLYTRQFEEESALQVLRQGRVEE